MAHEQLSPIDRLQQAVDANPPNIVAAKMAIAAVAEGITADPDEAEIGILHRASELAGQLASRLIDGAPQAEFVTHAITFGALARVFGGEPAVPAEATDMAGKSMAAGKSEHDA